MATTNLFFVAVCFLLSVSQINALQTQNGTIKITIGTTSGCLDTVSFIGQQLAEAYQEYRDFLQVEFVPWGRTVRAADNSLTCQFGPNDCWANRLHRCVLDFLKGNQDAQVHYMTCEFTNPRPAYLQGSYLCAQGVGLNLVDVDYCVAFAGGPLDVAAEQASREPMATINFVPSIHFNDVIDVSLHIQARQRLRSMICFALAEDPTSGVTNCQI